MDPVEISGIFHDISLLVAYVSGIVIAIITGKKNNINPSITTLLILICTLSYIFFSEFILIHAGNWLSLFRPGFVHIDRTAGMAGIVIGLFLSGMMLKIPLRVLHVFSIPLLVIVAVSNLGCLTGHCGEIQGAGLSLHELSSITTTSFPTKFSLSIQLTPLAVFRTIGGMLAIVVILSIRRKIKNPRNLALWVLSSLFWIIYINLFSSPSSALFNRMMGLNVFQWAIMLFNILLSLWLISNESASHRKFPKLRISPPPKYRIFSIYLFIFFLAFPDSSFLTKAHLQIFIIGFSITTLFLVYYFHTRLKPSVFRYATVVVLLGVGSAFLQASVFAPQERIPAPQNKSNRIDLEFIDPEILPVLKGEPAESILFQEPDITYILRDESVEETLNKRMITTSD